MSVESAGTSNLYRPSTATDVVVGASTTMTYKAMVGMVATSMRH